MGRPKKETTNTEGDNASENQLKKFLTHKDNKDFHYSFEETINYKVPSSSMLLNLEMDGGLPAGCHRMVGVNSGGKTSCALDFMKNFLDEASDSEQRRGIYVKCEGRFSPEIQKRSGVQLVEGVEEWGNGKCFVLDSHVYETVFALIKELITDNPSKTKYFFVIDSLDMMCRKVDLERSLEDANLVAGGALLTATFLKKIGLALSKRGHIALFISQLREEIKLNQYQASTPRQGGASGGHAIEHAASWVLSFNPRFKSDLIREKGDDKGKIIGHYCKVKFVKTDNEKNQVDVAYPIRYGRLNGRSVWIEQECVEMLLAFDMVKKAGAWITVDDSLLEEFEKNSIEFKKQHQGLDNFRIYLEEKPDATKYLTKKFTSLLTEN